MKTFCKAVALQVTLIFAITYTQWLAILTALLNHPCR
jgi:hypothetical protein